MTIRLVLITAVLLGVACEQQQSTSGDMSTAPETQPAATSPEMESDAASPEQPEPEADTAGMALVADEADMAPDDDAPENESAMEAPETQPEAVAAESQPEAAPEPPSRPSPMDVADGVKAAAIRNDPDHPVSEMVLESVRTTMQAAGCTIVDTLECDVLVLCSSPRRKWAVGRAPEEMVYLVETRMMPGDTALRTPPDWEARVPDLRWPALVNVELVEWQTRGDETWTMPVVTINLGRDGFSHPDFGREDLEQLQSAMEDWVAQRPWLGKRRR
jgi:hypothetical protein